MDQDKQDGQKIQHFLNNAKQIINLMEESKETVTALQNSLTEDEDQFSKLQNMLHDLQNMHNENTVSLEICEDQKEYLTEENKKFLDLAQSMYSACQGLYKEIGESNDELQKAEELLAEKDKQLLQNHNELKLQKNKLDEEFQQVNQQKEKFANVLMNQEQEKKELQLKIETVKNENETVRKISATKKAFLEAQNTKVSEDINQLTTTVLKLDQECLKLVNAIETEENKQNSAHTELENSKKDLDIQIAELTVEAQKRNEMLKDVQQNNQNLLNSLEQVRHSISTNEEHEKRHTELLIETQQKIKATEENADQKIKYLKCLIADSESNVSTKNDFIEQLKKDCSALQQKIDNTREDVTHIKESSKQLQEIPKIDLKIEIVKAERELVEIKSSIHSLKEDYDVDKKNYDEKIAEANLELSKHKNDIKLQNQAITESESSISKYKNELETIINENGDDTIALNNINEEIKLLKLKRERQQKITKPPEMIKSEIVERVVPPIKLSHWDSLSSTDGVDTPASIEIRNKLKRREQLQKKKK